MREHAPRAGLPAIAIVGRPNVGKSTMFNRLVGRRVALVDDRPGVTRDRREAEATLGDLSFRLVDTAGLEEAAADSLAGRTYAQTEVAIADADIVLMVIDARVGVTPVDEVFADMVRASGKPVIVVANKAEGRLPPGYHEAFALGLGTPVPFSAEHGEGLADLHEAVRTALPGGWPEALDAAPEKEAAAASTAAADSADDAEGGDDTLHLAIVGRPNVGKSTLVNRLLGTDRVVTGPEAGITRDAITLGWQYRDRRVQLVDTAGLRRRSRVTDRVERLSIEDTRRAIRYAQSVILLIDATVGLDRQDLTIASDVIEEGRAIVVALNKWDAVTDRNAAIEAIRDRLERSLTQVRGVPVVPVSALTGRGVDRLMDAVLAQDARWRRRVPTAGLNRWLEATLAAHPPPLIKGRRLKLRYVTQAKSRPPTFAVFSSRPDAVPEPYQRYLANELRTAFDLDGVPLRLLMRGGRNPYAPKAS